MKAGVPGRAGLSTPAVCVFVGGSEQEACGGKGVGMCLHRIQLFNTEEKGARGLFLPFVHICSRERPEGVIFAKSVLTFL